MKKLFFILMFCLIFLFNHNQLLAGKLKVTIGTKENVNNSNFKKHILLEVVFGVWKSPLIRLME